MQQQPAQPPPVVEQPSNATAGSVPSATPSGNVVATPSTPMTLPAQLRGASAPGGATGGHVSSLEDKWRTFMFALLPGPLQKQGTLTAIYGTIGGGSRQRFSVIQRADVISWAMENAKAYDGCRELKAHLDSVGSNSTAFADVEIPDALMAKVLKQRLSVLRAEGIEQKELQLAKKENAEKAAAALAAGLTVPVEPQDTPSKPIAPAGKTGKKDDKDKEKDKDPKDAKGERAKSSVKKAEKGGKGAGKAAVPEVPSRPESAQAAAEISKRKTKLRDRGAKPDQKETIIGDEPVDGPDVYYLLKDFSLTGVINSLMEDHSIPLHAIFRLDPLGLSNSTALSTSAGSSTTYSPSIAPVSASPGGTPGNSTFPEIVATDITATAPSSLATNVSGAAVTPASTANANGKASAGAGQQKDNKELSDPIEWMRSAPDESLWKQVAWFDVRTTGSLGEIPGGAVTSSGAVAPTGAPAGVQISGSNTASGSSGDLPRDVFDAIARKIYWLLQYQLNYQDFYSHDDIIRIPVCRSALGQSKELSNVSKELRHYKGFWRKLLSSGEDTLHGEREKWVGPELVMATLLDNLNQEDEDDSEQRLSGMEENRPALLLMQYFDRAVRRLAVAVNPFTSPSVALENSSRESQKESLGAQRNSFLRYGDWIGAIKHLLLDQATANSSDSAALSQADDSLLRLTRISFGSVLLEKIEKKLGSTLWKKCAETESEQLAKETEFSKLFVTAKGPTGIKLEFDSASRALQQLLFEKLLRDAGNDGDSETNVSLDEWCWSEILDRSSLAQALQIAKVSHPKVLVSYSPFTRRTLLAMISFGSVNAPSGNWTRELRIKSKLCFGMFHCLAERNRSIVHMDSHVSGSRSYIYSMGDKIVNGQMQHKYLYFRDGSHLRITTTSTIITDEERDTSMTLHWANEGGGSHSLSWTSRDQTARPPQFSAALSNGLTLCLTVQQDPELYAVGCVILVTLSTADGLVLQFTSGGLIQRWVGRKEPPFDIFRKQANPPEQSRLYAQSGHIIRYLSGDLIDILSPDGSTTCLRKGSWVTTLMDGSRFSTPATIAPAYPHTSTQSAPPPSSLTSLPSIRVVSETYIALRKTLKTREDMVSVTTTDSEVLTEHACGVRMVSRPPRNRAPSESPEDEASATARRDDSECITVETEGFATVEVHPGQRVCIARIPGVDARVERRVEPVEGEKKPLESYSLHFGKDRIDFDSKGNVHVTTSSATDCETALAIQWVEGTTTVFEGRDRIYVRPDGSHEHAADSKPPPPPPRVLRNPPRLFVINPDGTGQQLLRDSEARAFLASVKNQPGGAVREDAGAAAQSERDAGVVDEVKGESGYVRYITASWTLKGEGGSGRFGDAMAEGSEGVTVFRQLESHPKLSPAMRQQYVAGLARYQRAQEEKESSGRPAGVVDAEAPPPLPPFELRDSESRPVILGQERRATEEVIRKKYQLL
ncbi:hypothetical protein DFJ73DRAFT_962946 [Zopfochytrium polystomum]|nr:hypothetical protein DFJ73DRAFT_962946 [Zopfochytrium polystomum]